METQTQLLQVEHEQAERDLAHLDLLGTEALERVRELEQGGQLHAAQSAELEQKSEDIQRRITQLEREEAQNQAQLIELKQENAEASAHKMTLEANVARSRAQLEAQEHGSKDESV